MAAKALFTILSKKLHEQEIIFVDDIAMKEPKTKEAVAVLASLGKVKAYAGLPTDTHNAALVLLPIKDRATEKSFRNIPGVVASDVRNVNPMDLLTYKYVIIAKPENAIAFFEGKLVKKDENKKGKDGTTRAPEKKTAQIRDNSVVRGGSEHYENVLVRPRITEKATFSAEKGAYVFEIALSATKHDVRAAVKQLYQVTPIKVRVVPIPRKKRMSRRSRVIGMTSAGKKAYIYLKKGDTIDIT
jgi:ribosomal protein L23